MNKMIKLKKSKKLLDSSKTTAYIIRVIDLSERQCGKVFALYERIKSNLKRVRYTVVAYLLIFGALLYPLMLHLFPPGADIGHMLALSYTFEGTNVEGLLKQPPIFPFMIFLLNKASFGYDEVFFTIIKILGVALTLPLGMAFFLLSKQLSKSSLAAKFGFFLAVLNPLFLYEILWSGYSQFLGMTFAILSIYWLLKSEEGSKHGKLACALFASLTLGAHSYTAIFLYVFFLIYFIIRILTTEKKTTVLTSWAKIGALLLVFSIPYYLSYWNIWNDMKTAAFPSTFSLFLESIKWETIISIPVIVLAVWVLIVVTANSYSANFRQMNKSVEVLLTLTISGFLMFFLTPAVSANRVLYFLMVPLITFIAIGLSQMSVPRTLFHKREKEKSSKNIWMEGLAVTLVFLMATTSVTHYFLSINVFTPMNTESLDAFEAIRRDSKISDKVLVTSYWPEFDSWWLEGIAEREALERGSVRWFVLQSEVDRVILGKTLLFGTNIIDGGSLKLLDCSPYLSYYTQTIMAVSGAGALGILSFADAYTKIALRPSPSSATIVYPIVPGKSEIVSNSSLTVSHGANWGILEETMSLDNSQDLASVKYSCRALSGFVNNMTVGIMSFDDILFEEAKQQGNTFYVKYKHKWEGTTGAFQIKVKNNVTSAEDFKADVNGNSYLLLTFSPLDSASSLFEVMLDVKVDNADVGIPQTYSIYEKCEEEQIKYVYFRGESWIKEKFERDPNFALFFKEKDVVVYKYVGNKMSP
jgi:hypothetical protein